MSPSFQSKIISSILKWTKAKQQVEKQVQKPIKRSKKPFLPSSIQKRFACKARSYHDKEILTYESKEQQSRTHLFYLHGGAYVFEAGNIHWQFTRRIVEKSYCRMSLIDYPLAPEFSYRETFAMVEGAYDLLCEQYPDDDFVLIGDSAGGGIALALAQKLAHQKHPKLPIKNILISPWLDLTMSNPAIANYVDTDHLLTVPMLKHTASLYADGDDQTQYLLSPINGEFAELAPTMVFYSDAEVFYPDCEKLKALAESNKAQFEFKVYHKMIHDWAMFSIPERTQVIEEICAFIGA